MAITKNYSGDGVTPVADEATAYTLTGVAVWAVYKTNDTGQLMEYRGGGEATPENWWITRNTNSGDQDLTYIEAATQANVTPAMAVLAPVYLKTDQVSENDNPLQGLYKWVSGTRWDFQGLGETRYITGGGEFGTEWQLIAVGNTSSGGGNTLRIPRTKDNPSLEKGTWTTNYTGGALDEELVDELEGFCTPVSEYAIANSIKVIADKTAAYALTGVAVGAVYRTADTGQIMEYLGDVLPKYNSFTIAGSNGIGAGSLTINGRYSYNVVTGTWLHEDSANTNRFLFGFSIYEVGVEGAAHFYDDGSPATTGNPATALSWDVADGTGVLQPSEFTIADPASNPFNWKINGVVNVFDNDEKQLLTNLPDGQQVEIVGEGGRIERFNGLTLTNGAFGAVVTGATATGYTASNPANGIYVLNRWSLTDSSTIDPTISSDLPDLDYPPLSFWSTSSPNEQYVICVEASTGKWIIVDYWMFGTTVFRSVETAATTSLDQVTWVAVGEGGALPTISEVKWSSDSNWFAIKNTYEVKVYNDNASAFLVNGVSCGPSVFTNVGWMVADEGITTNYSANPLIVVEIDGVGLVPEPPTLLTGGRCFLQTSVHARALITLYISA